MGTYTLDATCTDDTYANQGNPTLTRDALNRLWLGEGSSGLIDQIYVKFDLSSIPRASVISSATLQLYSYDGSNDWSGSIATAAILASASWTEEALTWNNRPGTQGSASATVNVSSANWNTYVSWNVTSHVQAIANGTYTNYGWRVYYTGTSSSTRKEFRDKEYSSGAYRPKLSVTYWTPDVWCNIGGVWKRAEAVYVNVGGVWKTSTQIAGNIGGTWQD